MTKSSQSTQFNNYNDEKSCMRCTSNKKCDLYFIEPVTIRKTHSDPSFCPISKSIINNHTIDNHRVRKNHICTCSLNNENFTVANSNCRRQKHTYTCEQNARILKEIEQNVLLKRTHSAPRNFKINFQKLCNKIDCNNCEHFTSQNCSNRPNGNNCNFSNIWNDEYSFNHKDYIPLSNHSCEDISPNLTNIKNFNINDNHRKICYCKNSTMNKCPLCFNDIVPSADIVKNLTMNRNLIGKSNEFYFSPQHDSITNYFTYLCYNTGFIKTANLRNWWVIVIILFVTIVVGFGVPISLTFNSNASLEERMELATRLLTEVPLIDGHNDLPWNIRKFLHNQLSHFHFNSDFRNITPWSTSIWSHTDLPRLKQGFVSAQFWAAYVPCEAQNKDAVQVTLEQIDVIRRFTDSYHPPLTFCTSSQDILNAFERKEICSLIGVEGGHSISNSLSVLRNYYYLGVRYLTLTSTCNTPWADCSLVDNQQIREKHNGLTEFGKTIIMEMNRLGMLIDLSHVSVETMNDALTISKAPVIFSHSSTFSLCNSTRNVPDFILKKLAANKGVIMVNFYSRFLTCKDYATVFDAVEHINHIREVAGIESVGIGAGFDGINFTPKGLEDVSSYPTLFAELIGTGNWTVEELKQLAGLNLLRVFQQVERIRDDFKKANVRPYEDVLVHAIDNKCSTKNLF